MVAELSRQVTPEEYLVLDRQAERRHELVAGIIRPVSAGTREHGLISLNVGSEISRLLRDRPCEVYAGNVRVKLSAKGDYVYPDVVVALGDIEFENGETLLNPVMVIEVLSPTTEAYDRGRKAAMYRRCASLQQYVLISPDRASVELIARERGQWVLTEACSLDEKAYLSCVDCDLPLAEVYAKVRFGEAPVREANPLADSA